MSDPQPCIVAIDGLAPCRRIIHVDMDAFYASVEQRDDPSLRGRPVAVGGSRQRGVVAAASYEARRYGVRSAMPSSTARRMCPDLVFVPPRFETYKEVSRHIHAIFAEYTSLIQPLSLDEAYLDVSAPLLDRGSATAIAREIRARIHTRTGLTASAGVSYNKLLAKLASDHRKPDGLFVITPRMGPGFVAPLPVGRFHGIGPRTAEKMQRLGIHTGLDLRGCSREFLIRQFGRTGSYYHDVARAQDERPVVTDRQRKSVGAENTFAVDLTHWDEVPAVLDPILAKVWEVYSRAGLPGRTVTVKVKYSDFQVVTRSRSDVRPITALRTIEQASTDLLRPLFSCTRGVRLLGVTVSNLDAASRETGEQLALGLG